MLYLGNSGAIAAAVIVTLLGLAALAGVIAAIVFIVMKRRKKDTYNPPSRPSHRVKTTTPSVKVVQPGKHTAGHRAPNSSVTPSAPPRYDDVVGHEKSSVPSRPPPPKPVTRPAPPKPPPPINRPAAKPHPVAPSTSKPPPQGESKAV